MYSNEKDDDVHGKEETISKNLVFYVSVESTTDVYISNTPY